ncbi:hypothetical protein O6H91_22G040500 [Diphasiastrum complanatum]|uniref:Uncharacterized protein n=1 Tax=Diphasiastrum complanatum TaxID=34168 RepID=A0ACC2AF14_DIPCM|nr:hypothetical protein O6H91_22G040500 [Diphasiastrum complanatum]
MFVWVTSRWKHLILLVKYQLIDETRVQKTGLQLKMLGRLDSSMRSQTSIMDEELRANADETDCIEMEESASETQPSISTVTLAPRDVENSMHPTKTAIYDHNYGHSLDFFDSVPAAPPEISRNLDTVFTVRRGAAACADKEVRSSAESISFNQEPVGSADRDAIFAQVVRDRATSHIRAWEQSEKMKSFNRYNKKMSRIAAWEKARKAKAEAELRKAEEKLEKKRAAIVEEKQNEIARAQRKAEEMKANGEAQRGEELLKVEEMAAKYRASGKLPKQMLFSCSCTCFQMLPCHRSS